MAYICGGSPPRSVTAVLSFTQLASGGLSVVQMAQRMRNGTLPVQCEPSATANLGVGAPELHSFFVFFFYNIYYIYSLHLLDWE